MNELVEKIKEELATLRGKVTAAVMAFIVAVISAVQLGVVDLAEMANEFLGEQAEQVEQMADE